MTNNLINNIEKAFIEIGYRRHFIQKKYEYVDLFSLNMSTRTIERAIFGQEPFDYRSACFGIQISNPGCSSSDLIPGIKALGAPQVFIINNGTTERWVITTKEAVLREKYETSKLPNIIMENSEDWKPESIMRAKSGFTTPGATQLDFIDFGLLPALEHEVGRKIDYLLRIILNHTEEDFKRFNLQFNASAVFKIVFSLLAAKLFKDRNIPISNNIDFSVPETALQAVRSHYGSQLMSATEQLPEKTLGYISKEIGQSFSLKNISVDSLTYIYENTFVSPESRQELGIHSTPSFVADYLLAQIPIEELHRTQWHILDPMCGHGILLIAAMRRIRDLLPRDWGGQRRHKFFVECLHGIEIDAFSIEVARMCLMLADFPESNGWDIKRLDAFKDKEIENSSKKSMILVANPPFEKMIMDDKTVPKPLELLRRALPSLPKGALIGLILPRSFLDSSTYKTERKFLNDNFEINTITTLPDKVFLYSDAETAIISAKKRNPLKSKTLIYREVRDAHREAFKLRYGVTWQEKIPQSYFDVTRENKLVVPMLKEVWDRLSLYPSLKEVAIIKTGIRYKTGLPLNEIVQYSEFHNSQKGIFNVTEGFYQYAAYDDVYMSIKKQNIKNAAWNYNWDIPKVVLPAARMSRGPWRFAAAIDIEGRILSRRFYGVRPKLRFINVYLLSALLNSPVAQAFVYCNVSERDILIKTYNEIPVPRPEDLMQSEPIISNLVKLYLKEIKTDKKQAFDTLLKIDSEILKLYHLPPKMERQLLDIFWEQKRPVPFEFKGYIPPEMLSWIPLHIYISKSFQEATLEKVMSRIPVTEDKKLINYIKKVGTE